MKELHIAGGILLTEEPQRLPEALLAPLRKRWQEDEDDDLLDTLLTHAASIAQPCAFLRPAQVNERPGTPAGDNSAAGDNTAIENNIAAAGDNTVFLDGYPFQSTLVAEKLTQAGGTVVAFVNTCGQALYEARLLYKDDFFANAIWDDIMLAYLRLIGDRMHRYLGDHFSPPVDGKRQFAILNPGSLPAWNIWGQKELFALLGQGAELAGVELSPSMLMLPTKSGSGIAFATAEPYENCMHCPRLDCPNRRAPYREE